MCVEDLATAAMSADDTALFGPANSYCFQGAPSTVKAPCTEPSGATHQISKCVRNLDTAAIPDDIAALFGGAASNAFHCGSRAAARIPSRVVLPCGEPD